MRKIKKLAAVILGLMIVVCGFAGKVYAEESAWDIENTLEQSECRQGDTVLMSVYLKGNGSDFISQQMSSVSGVLEYDTSLFKVEKADILPAESGKVKEWSFDQESGTFDIRYSEDVTVQDKGMMLQIRLHTAADASTGKTTVCVTQMKWSNTAGSQKAEIEHHVPARITIAKAEAPSAAGDVNQDGKVNLTDIKLIMQHYNGAQTLNSQQQKNADVNADGKVNLTDAKLIMRYYNGEITGF